METLPCLPDLVLTAEARTPAGVLPGRSSECGKPSCRRALARLGLCRMHYDALSHGDRARLRLERRRSRVETGPAKPARPAPVAIQHRPKGRPRGWCPKKPMDSAFRFLLAFQRKYFGFTVPELMVELDASNRQIYRWLHAAEDAGVPITKVGERWRLVRAP